MTDKEIKRIEKMAQLKKTNAIAGIIFMIVGVILTGWPGAAMSAVATLFGVTVLVIGIGFIVTNAIGKKEGITGNIFLVLGIIMAIIGTWIIISPQWLINIIPLAFGVVVVIDGIANLSESVLSGRQGYKGWWISLILSVLTIALGAYLVIRPFEVATAVARIIGIILIYNGVSDLLIVSKLNTKIKDIN